VILAATSLPASQVPDVGVPHVDKLAHLGLYGVLGALVARSLPRGAGALPSMRLLLLALAAIALFGAADEWHQQWVPGRSADTLDWCADMVGATFALRLAARRRPRLEQPT
jgi:VanZ family protein